MTSATPHPGPPELLLRAVDALPPHDRDRVLVWLLDSSPRTPRGAWMLRSYRQGVVARVPELPPRTHEYLLASGTGGPGAEEMSGEQLQVVPIRLTVDQHRRLRQWCVEHNFTMATVVRGLVDRFLHSQGPGGTSPEPEDPSNTEDPGTPQQ
jgi:hypothetical protein